MQMYVNYYTRELMNEGDTPPLALSSAPIKVMLL